MEDDFEKWLQQKNAAWYLLNERQFLWYLNEWLNKVEDERKEQKEDEVV